MKNKEYFNASNEAHRRAFANFLLNGNKWGIEGCPFRPKCPYPSVIQQAYAEVSNYYLSKEF